MVGGEKRGGKGDLGLFLYSQKRKNKNSALRGCDAELGTPGQSRGENCWLDGLMFNLLANSVEGGEREHN